MEREQILTGLVNDPEYKDICRRIGGDYADDLYQELVLAFLEMPDDKLQQLDATCLKCYFVRMAQGQFQRRNSSFFRKYRLDNRMVNDHKDDILQACEPTGPDPDLVEKVEAVVNDSYWYDQGLFKLYAEMGTIREVSDKTGIPSASVAVTVRDFKKIIRKKLKKHD